MLRIDELEHLPPVLSLLLYEMGHCKSWDDMRKRVKSMLKDLSNQAEIFDDHQVTQRENFTGFDTHLHGATDLLSYGHSCSSLDCRIAAADRVARSFGLLSDRIWMTDLLSEKFLDFGEPTDAKIDNVIEDTLVITRLLPLISAGILRFKSPWLSTCNSCLEEFERQVEISTAELTDIFISEFKIHKRDGGDFYVDTGTCFDPSLRIVSQTNSGDKFPTLREITEKCIYNEIRTALWTAREASFTKGAVVSNSRVAMAGLLKQDGRLNDVNTLKLLDNERGLTIPWVSELDPMQIIDLRQEASEALPFFREKFAQAMAIDNSTNNNQDSLKKLITELREQSIEVRAELTSLQKNSSRFWKTTYGVLGLSISAYGVANDEVFAGMAGLLPIIHLLIDHKSGHEAEVSKITSKPGYILIKAQDILAHAH